MPYDVKIVTVSTAGQLTHQTYPVPDKVAGTYSLVQRVLKNMNTIPGEDEQSPGWGCALFDRLLRVPGQKDAEAKTVATGALAKCLFDLQKSPPPEPELAVTGLNLTSISYDSDENAWVLTVDLTTKSTVISITP